MLPRAGRIYTEWQILYRGAECLSIIGSDQNGTYLREYAVLLSLQGKKPFIIKYTLAVYEAISLERSTTA